MVRTLLIAAAFAAVGHAAPVPKDFVKTAKQDGKWKVTAYELNGRESKSPIILNQTWTIEGGNLTITREAGGKGGGKGGPGLLTMKVKLKTDPKKSPAELDYIQASGTTRLGVFAVDGDTLTVCLALGLDAERPSNLDGGPGVQKHTFARVKDK